LSHEPSSTSDGKLPLALQRFHARWPEGHQRFARHTVDDSFRKLAQLVGIRGPRGKGPSFHGLRHRFAVRRLQAWYQDGVDVQGMLPALATYMGHVRYTDTAYYLTATAELMGLAAARYHRSPRSRRGGS